MKSTLLEKLDLRISSSEKAILKRQSDSLGLSMSVYIRKWIGMGCIVDGLSEAILEEVSSPVSYEGISEYCSRNFDIQLDYEDQRRLEEEAQRLALEAGCLVNLKGRYFYIIENGNFRKINSYG